MVESNLKGQRWDVFCAIPDVARSILDVGCGDGHGFLAQRRRGVRVVGIDIDERCIHSAKRVLDDAAVVNLELEDWTERIGERFDVVAFNDCLEHLVDPWRVLRQARELLTPQGVVVASIPNVRQWRILAKAALGRWNYQTEHAGTVQRGHLRFFTRSTIDDMFVEAGYHPPQHHFPLETFHLSKSDRVLHHLTMRRIPDLWYGSYTVSARPAAELMAHASELGAA